MNEKDQAKGERRVQQILIDPLEGVGLTKPSAMRKAQFDLMKRGLCQKLAYMSDRGLTALREWSEAHPGGKDRDRFPIALKILQQARAIELPDTGPSPLMISVFSHGVGQTALEKGYAPELLKHLRSSREFPGAWTISKIREAADDPMRRLQSIEARLSRGEPVSSDGKAFRDTRRVAIRKCEEIAELGRKGSAA